MSICRPLAGRWLCVPQQAENHMRQVWGTFAQCVLHFEHVANGPGIAVCKGRVRFDHSGRAECC
jgi:hypothetical protein